MILKIIRWIFLVPITAACFLLSPNVLYKILSIIERVLHFITTFGTWYYNDGEIRFAIVTKLLSYLIAGGLTGVVAGYVVPSGNEKVTSFLVGITTIFISTLGVIGNWDSAGWLISLLYVILFLISSAIAVGFAYSIQKRKRQND